MKSLLIYGLSQSKIIFATFLSLSLTSANAFAAGRTTGMTLAEAQARGPKEDPQAFTLDEAVNIALAGGSTTIGRAKAQIDEAGGNLDAAKAQRLPTISATIGAGANSVVGGSSGTYTNHSTSVTVPLPFLNHAITASINSASNLELSSTQLYNAQVNQAILLVTVDYYNTVKAQKDLQASQHLLDESVKYFKQEGNKSAEGAGSKQDALRASGGANRARTDLTNKQAAVKTACAALLNILSLTAADTVNCDHLVDPTPQLPFKIDVAMAAAKAKVSRPEIAAYEAQIAAAKSQLSGIGGINNLTAQAGVTNGSPGSIPGSSTTGVAGLDPFHRGNVNTVGGTLNYTFGFKNSGEKRAANARVNEASITLQDAENKISSDVINAVAALSQAYANQTTAQKTYTDAVNLIDLDKGQAAAGAGTTDSTSYIQDLTNFHQAEQDLLDANCNVAEAIAQLQAAVGAPPGMNVSQFLIGLAR